MAIKLIKGPEVIYNEVEKEATISINSKLIKVKKSIKEDTEFSQYDNNEEYSKEFEKLTEEEQEEVTDFVNDDINWME